MSTVRSRKNKGVRLQNWVRDKLVEYSDGRLEEDDIRRAIMGEKGADVKVCNPHKTELFPFAVECKNQEKVNVWSAYEQAGANHSNLIPLVVLKRNNTKPLVMMDAEMFISMVLDSSNIKT